MGLFETIGNIAAGIQGSRLGKKQMELGSQMFNAGVTLSQSKKRPTLDIDTMTTPDAINRLVEISRMRQYENAPGYSQAQNQIGQSTAQTLKAISEMGSGSETLGTVGDIYAQNLAANRDLSVNNAMYKDQAEQQYLSALGLLGEQENQNFLFNTEAGLKEFDWNKAKPYLALQQKASALQSMGLSSQWEGLKTKMGSWAKTFQGVGSSLDQGVEQALSVLTGGVTGGI